MAKDYHSKFLFVIFRHRPFSVFSIHRNREIPPLNTKEHLLLLLGLELGELLLTASLVSLSTGLSVEDKVPPAEAGCVVADELLVVKIVVLGTSPEGEDVAQAPGEVVTAVGIDGLEKTENDPKVHGDEVKIASDAKEDDGRSDDSDSEESCFDGRSILSSETERSGVGVMHLVNRLVERTVVQSSVEKVVPGILQNEANSNLNSHLPERRERNTILHAQVGSDGVEEPDLRKFGGKVADENDGGAIPLLLEGGHLLRLKLPLVEIGNLVHDHERNAATEVDELVHDEAHDSGSESIILHKEVPGSPELLRVAKMDLILGDLIEDTEVVVVRAVERPNNSRIKDLHGCGVEDSSRRKLHRK